MSQYFIDTFYLVALANRKDPWHDLVVMFSQSLDGCHLYTVDEVLTEFLNFVSEYGPRSREQAANVVQELLN
jgi:predicted nucleic acid-binding protein